ncbi:MAG: hypothetical protein LC769_03040, partial [Chloroflexi bacterium]|nr:hypothetical protein [Chloroflexota bacterium]
SGYVRFLFDGTSAGPAYPFLSSRDPYNINTFGAIGNRAWFPFFGEISGSSGPIYNPDGTYYGPISVGGGVNYPCGVCDIPPAMGAPVLSSPADGATGQTLTPTFTWTVGANAASHEVQISTDSTFVTTTAGAYTAVGTSLTPLTALAYATTYYWRARGLFDIHSGPASSARSFETALVWETNTAAINKSLSLFNASTGLNNAPPSGWEQPSFNDAAWNPTYDANTGTTGSTSPTSVWCNATGAASNTEEALFRLYITVPAGTISSATLTYTVDDYMSGVYVNGTLISGTVETSQPAHTAGPFTIPSGLLVAGTNVIAFHGANLTYSGPGKASIDGRINASR